MSTNDLRVAHVVLSLESGGTETLVVDLVKRLALRADINVYCLDCFGSRAADIRASVGAMELIGRHPGFDVNVSRRIRGIARAQRINVLHCHHYSPFVYGRLAALALPHVSVVYTEHGRLSDAVPSRRRRMANQIFGRLPGQFFAVSENLREFMSAEGFPRRRIEVVHNGIDSGPRPVPAHRTRARQMLRLAETTFVAGTAARLDPVKDLGTMLRAFVIVRASVPGARLVVAGEGVERRDLQETAARLGLADAVSFLGHRPDVRTLLPALDVYVNSSISEGLSVTILEAMAAGLPVVATQAGGTPEVVLDGQTGLLAPARNPQTLSDRLLRLASDIPLRMALGAAGRERVVAMFSADRMADRYLQAYRAAARGGE